MKIYKTKKLIDSPVGTVSVGTQSIFEGSHYWFPYVGHKRDEIKGWLGSAFGISNPETMPEWFEDVTPLPENKVNPLPNQKPAHLFVIDGNLLKPEISKKFSNAMENVGYGEGFWLLDDWFKQFINKL